VDIQAVLAGVGRAIGAGHAQSLAQEIRARGSVDEAIAALAADESSARLSLLLAYRAALAEASQPLLRVGRLRLNAQDIDSRAETLWREAAEDAGLAAARRLRGEANLARTFERRAAAAESLAAELESEAFEMRLEAAQIEAEHARRQSLGQALRGLAA
jgi:hypothetical protein